jgi:hypothetical protein
MIGGWGAAGSLAQVLEQASGANQATALSLNFPRAWHTATLVPDCAVLVFGGIDASGKIVTAAELFDPVAKTLTTLASAPTPRAYHTATLLTDGTVLIAGGVSNDGEVLRTAEIWGPASGHGQASSGRACDATA